MQQHGGLTRNKRVTERPEAGAEQRDTASTPAAAPAPTREPEKNG
jgi:hypothetical protein